MFVSQSYSVLRLQCFCLCNFTYTKQLIPLLRHVLMKQHLLKRLPTFVFANGKSKWLFPKTSNLSDIKVPTFDSILYVNDNYFQTRLPPTVLGFLVLYIPMYCCSKFICFCRVFDIRCSLGPQGPVWDRGSKFSPPTRLISPSCLLAKQWWPFHKFSSQAFHRSWRPPGFLLIKFLQPVPLVFLAIK